MKNKLKLFWRWLVLPAPPRGAKYADNPNLPGLAPTDVVPLSDLQILQMQLNVLTDRAQEFDRINGMQKRIGQFITSHYGEDADSGLHSRIGGDLADLVIYYLKQERTHSARFRPAPNRHSQAHEMPGYSMYGESFEGAKESTAQPPKTPYYTPDYTLYDKPSHDRKAKGEDTNV